MTRNEFGIRIGDSIFGPILVWIWPILGCILPVLAPILAVMTPKMPLIGVKLGLNDQI